MNPFTSDELSVIQNQEFLLTKAEALQKVSQLLTEVRAHLAAVVEQSEFEFPYKINHTTAKISRGENYESLPYQILDFPARFTQEDTFAFRTMFWWGNFFSVTLLLGGESVQKFRHKLIQSIDHLLDNNTYLGIGTSPWEHHFRSDNCKILEGEDKKLMHDLEFLKLSKKIPLNEWKNLKLLSPKFLETILNLLK